jgi:hypothetical protein
VTERHATSLRAHLERVLALVERGLESRLAEPQPVEALAYRWRAGRLEPIANPDLYPLDALLGVELSVGRLRADVAAFCAGRPALDALLYGERGTGKSSAVRGLLREFGAKGFRLIEVSREGLLELPAIFAAVRGRPERFALFCDDLSFEPHDPGYRALKACLDGGLEARPENLLILCTSNRRHLVSERHADNLEARIDAQGDLHPGETAEEKLSLSDRFGLLLPFLSFDQAGYLRIVDHHARELGLEGMPRGELHRLALRYALERGGRSGRTARHACIAIAQGFEISG